MSEKRAHYQGLNSSGKRAAVLSAGSVEELDEMWSAWRERGHRDESILHMLVLKQKASLGATLTESEAEVVGRVERAARAGAERQAIRGRFRTA